MNSGPDLHYHLRSRTAGSFGTSPLGRIAESLTLTWFRFEFVLSWLVVLVGIVASLGLGTGAAALAILLSPMTALALWLLLKLTGWLFYFVPKIGPLWGWGRLLFLWLFSRLIVEPAPAIDLPAWHSYR